MSECTHACMRACMSFEKRRSCKLECYATDTPITGVSTTYVKKFFILFACPVEDVAAQNLSAATLPATVDVPKTSVMSLSHLC